MEFGQDYNLHRWKVEPDTHKIMPLRRSSPPPIIPQEMVDKSWTSLNFRDVNENYENIKK
jgi:hypothetical protein